MRWLNRDKPNSIGALGWKIVNEHINYLISSSADAGWSGVGNTGRICESIESGITPTFDTGIDNDSAMIRQIRSLTVKDKGLSWLFADLTRMQTLCLLAAVLAEGRRTIQGEPLSNGHIAATLPVFAAELRLGPVHKAPSEKTFANNVAEGRRRFMLKLQAELVARLSAEQLRAIA
ncbi:hypothetical protein [Marinomonas transparens]|uniref:Uncharacterized protein n=1 Tax=Marinomonas transparens TaxID=2795388 RepID=A0A934JR01_9GAMM|nr:hypothetical protein [Marinomonas transparens]MBJ7536646.1 hypothetical protein [Marinomonas transparens]